MIELLIATRFLVDFFWEYKILSAIQVLGFAFLFYIINIKNTKKRIIVTSIDIVAFLFFLTIFQSFALQANDETLVTMVKVGLFFLIYSAGRVADVQFRYTKALSNLCVVALGLFLLMGSMGYGFQAWGGALTYTGGYFFKTDLALASCLLLMIIFNGLTNKFILSICWLSAMWIVLLTNARIFIPIVVALPLINYFVRTGFADLRTLKARKWKSILIASVLIGAVVAFMGLADSDEGYLTISFTDFMSARNTQGRSVIWDALLAGFANSDILTQFFGGGLDADRILVSGFAEITGVEDANSHNIYLYTLVSTGILGFALACYLLFQLISIFNLVENSDERIIRLKVNVASLITMLLVAGLTTDAIVRPQLMILTCFFVGMLVQVYTHRRVHFV